MRWVNKNQLLQINSVHCIREIGQHLYKLVNSHMNEGVLNDSVVVVMTAFHSNK